MACAAAVSAVRRALPPAAAPLHRRPLAPLTAFEIFEALNWWTLDTIEEALAELKKSGDCVAESKETEKAYRQSIGPRARTTR